MAISPITPRVRAAFLDFGGLKALTPFEIASTPVSAEAPDAKARRTTSSVTAPTPTVVGSVTCACGQAPVAHFPTPTATRTYMTATNAYVGKREEQPRLADASEVGQRQQHDAEERESDLVRLEGRHGGGQSEDPCCDGDGNREHVVDEERGGREKARKPPEIVARDHVGSSARLVRAHGLPVGKDDDREQRGDRGGDREHEVSGACRRGDEDNECRLGRVGDGGKRIRREDGQRELLREQGVVHLAARPWPADERSLDGDGSARAPLADLRHASSPSSARIVAMRSLRSRADKP